MADRDIRTSVELKVMMDAVGVNLSKANVARLVSGNPRRVSSSTMFGLTEVLKCTAADLWRNPNQPNTPIDAGNPASRVTSKNVTARSKISEEASPKTKGLEDPGVGPPAVPFNEPKDFD
jgi:hypothetical protein